MRMSPEDYVDFERKRLAGGKKPSPKPAGVQRWQALGRLPKDKMNKTEAAYAEHLDRQKLAGAVRDWKFHPMNIRLADRTYYEVDFLVLHADMTLAIHETKGGYTSEKGQLKIKLVAEVMPWFRMIKATKLPAKQGGGFALEEFNA